MNTGALIINGFILGLCAIIFIVLGVIQYKSKKPSGFYTGEQFNPSEISDIGAWNHRHGIMWILYGSLFPILWGLSFFISSSPMYLLVFMGIILVPLPFMIVYHHYLEKRYRIKTGNTAD